MIFESECKSQSSQAVSKGNLINAFRCLNINSKCQRKGVLIKCSRIQMECRLFCSQRTICLHYPIFFLSLNLLNDSIYAWHLYNKHYALSSLTIETAGIWRGGKSKDFQTFTDTQITGYQNSNKLREWMRESTIIAWFCILTWNRVQFQYCLFSKNDLLV